MQKARSTVSQALVVACTVVLFVGNARALDTFVNKIPNGKLAMPDGCPNCHTDGGGACTVIGGANTCTSFSLAAQALGVSSLPDGINGTFPADVWTKLYDVDSDGDGQTNGEELGDPCGTWLPNTIAARTSDITNPGSPASKRATPDPKNCGGAGGDAGTDATSPMTIMSGPVTPIDTTNAKGYGGMRADTGCAAARGHAAENGTFGLLLLGMFLGRLYIRRRCQP